MSNHGAVKHPGNAYEQTKEILTAVKSLLLARGFRLEDVVTTRLFVTNIVAWDDYARAHQEFFRSTMPTSSIVQVAKLVDPRLVIEMEFMAIRGTSAAESVRVDLVR